MNTVFTIGDVITIVLFLVTIGGVVYKFGHFSASIKVKVSNLETRLKEKDKKDYAQDDAIAKIRQEMNTGLGKIFTMLGTLDERTKNIQKALADK